MAWEVALLAEPLACVLHGVDRLGDAAGNDAIVVGAGPIGLLERLGSAPRRDRGGGRGALPSRRAMAEKLGFNVVGETVRELGWSDAAVVVDATGVPQAIEEAFTMLRRGGTLLLMGVAKPGSVISLDPHRLNWQELDGRRLDRGERDLRRVPSTCSEAGRSSGTDRHPQRTPR